MDIRKGKNGKFVFSEQDTNKIVCLYKESGSCASAMKEFGVSKSVILNLLKNNGVEIVKPCDRKFYNGVTIDRTRFVKFDNEFDCYFYGLLLADGSLAEPKNTIQISLEISDLHILKELKEYLNSSNKIHTVKSVRKFKETTMCSFVFGDKIISENLKLQGFEPKKTTKEKLPKFIKEYPEMEKHFWRGFVDGDGSLRQIHSSILELCGSFEIISGFENYCQKIGCAPKKFRSDNKTSNFYRISYSGEDARKIARELYKESKIKLNRKYETYLKFEEFQLHLDSRKKETYMKYIRFVKNSYIVQYNGKYLGSCKSLEDAMKMRDGYLRSIGK